MDRNQRPHSRRKTVGSGSAGVHHGNKVDTGNRPVGSGPRPQSSQYGAGSQNEYRDSQRALFQGLNLKSVLGVIAVILVAVFLLKNCGGESLLSGILGGLGDMGGFTNVLDEPENITPASSSQADLSVSSRARDKRVVLRGNGEDTVTIMIYMCGTDLESKYGMASKDLQEMMSADISDKVNIIVETGGCSKWQTRGISNSKNQIYKVETGGMRCLDDNVGSSAMTDPKNLASFIKFCTDNYDASRNILILWDHGGGSLSGYGYDEKKPESSSMTLAKLKTALDSSACAFDFIGFDACLMATLETALVCNNYADYLLASEETEPGTGWDYTGWLNKISANTSISTVELGKVIIDDFVRASKRASPAANVTLSLVDLAELQGTVPDAFREFSSSTTELLKTDNYKKVSDARAGVRQFAQQNRINQVDLVDLAERIGTDEAKELAKALKGCVKYNSTTMSRCYGLSIFFPYENKSSVNSAVSSYNALGIDSEYTECIKSFASLSLGGQLAGGTSQVPGLDLGSLLGGLTGSGSSSSGGSDLFGTLLSSCLGSGTSSSASSSSSPIGSLLGSFMGSGGSATAGSSLDAGSIISLLGAFSGRSMPAEGSWIDADLIAENAENIAENFVDPSHITAAYKNDKKVLSLTDEEWNLIQTVELNVYVRDGEGFVDMGLDNTFEWYEDDLLLEYDGTWLTLNGNACAYYLVSDTKTDDGEWVTVGRIPAKLNGEMVNLRVVFDDEHPEGIVTGAYKQYGDETDVQAKGEIAIRAGDKIQLLCDYYDPDGSWNGAYTLGKQFTVPETGLTLVNLKLDAEETTAMYKLTDIYGNAFWISIDD